MVRTTNNSQSANFALQELPAAVNTQNPNVAVTKTTTSASVKSGSAASVTGQSEPGTSNTSRPILTATNPQNSSINENTPARSSSAAIPISKHLNANSSTAQANSSKSSVSSAATNEERNVSSYQNQYTSSGYVSQHTLGSSSGGFQNHYVSAPSSSQIASNIHLSAPNGNSSSQNDPVAQPQNNPQLIGLTERQFSELLGNIQSRQSSRITTFSSCTARFNGGRNVSKVEDFIATILVFKDAEDVPDFYALTSFPLLLEGYASAWWQGVKNEARCFDDAIDLLRNAFSPPKPDWRIFAEIFQDKQKVNENTDVFVCRKRRLFAQLKEKVSEKMIINMLFSQLSIHIRDKISNEGINSFQDLLSKARDIECSYNENRDSFMKQIESKEKTAARCTFCRKKNHTADVCYKRIEAEKKPKPDENKLNCYGCGAVGYYRSNCPNCNKNNPMQSPKEMEFNCMQTTMIGRNVPTVDINILGMNGVAYMDTAARTSVAGYALYQKLKEKQVHFQKVLAEIVLADGIPRKEVVDCAIVNISIGKRFEQIRLICMPNANGNRTLLGIDFLERIGVVMDLAQRTWHFKDEAKKIFSFNMTSPTVSNTLFIQQTQIINKSTQISNVQTFLSKFVEGNSNTENNAYDSKAIDEIFKDSVPDSYEPPKKKRDLFPPLQKVNNIPIEPDELGYNQIQLNTFEIYLREDEAPTLKESEKDQLITMFTTYRSIFENITKPIQGIEHKINTGDHQPISTVPYRISPAMKRKLRTELDKMLEEDVITEMESPWAFPVVLIPKKDGSVRLCVDYRRLNAITVTDTYPLPRMDDVLHAAKATPFMTTLDLKAGYWQVQISEEDKLKTAFTTPYGIFVFNRMPFGLKNAPATFQRIIDKFRMTLPNVLILAYLDDIIVCSKDFETHIQDLKLVFEKLQKLGFHLNRDKCFFCRPEVKYLGHILTQNGLKIDPEKTRAILNRPDPKNVKQLISFLQTCSWFRRFIPQFAEIAKPLTNLTKKKSVWKWKTEEKATFNKLKELLTSPPILQQVNEDAKFYIRTDASNYALGAVLLQGEKEDERPIEYASRLLLPAERNYSTTEREALGVVWAVFKFRGYIEGAEVVVLTDHQPLRWLFTLKTPTGRLARWALLLQSYNLTFGYTPGKQNVVADTLSRPPCSDETCSVSCECNSIEIDFPVVGTAEFRSSQLEDENIKKIIESFENDDDNITLYTNRGYMMIDGILYRYCSNEDSEKGQLVLPKQLRQDILHKFHNDPVAGHYGIDKTTSRITPHFYWSGIRADIEKYVKSCDECKKYKPTNFRPIGLMQTVSSNKRFEIIAIDLFGPLPKTNDGYQWVLIVEDVCSRWIELFALREATAENCALTFLNEIVLRFGVPRRIHSDNGSQFISSLMQKLTFCLGIKQSFTPIYHPEANPVERKNRDLKTQLSICVKTDHTKWNLMLPTIRFAMNTVKCDSTGYSAAFITFGRELRTPTEANYDFKAIVRSENFIPQITPHLLRLANVLGNVQETQEIMQDKNKKLKDIKRQPQPTLNIGDKVLVATHILSKANQGLTSKFTPRRDGPYIIMDKKGSSCFVIAAIEKPTIPIATHHVSALTPYNDHATSSKPIYPIRQRGRPANNNNATQQPPKPNSQIQKPQTSNFNCKPTDTIQSNMVNDIQSSHYIQDLRRSSRMRRPPNRPDV